VWKRLTPVGASSTFCFQERLGPLLYLPPSFTAHTISSPIDWRINNRRKHSVWRSTLVRAAKADESNTDKNERKTSETKEKQVKRKQTLLPDHHLASA